MTPTLSIAALALMIAAASYAPTKFNCDTALIEGKPSGACDNKLGQFIDARDGPRVAGRPTIAVRYQPEWGTNLYVEAVALLQRQGPRYRVLWSHSVVQATAGLPGVADEATVYAWTFNPGSQRISVSGSRTVGKVVKIRTGEALGRRTRLSPEAYCYAIGARRFQRCRSNSA
jgi:hypothetical protein